MIIKHSPNEKGFSLMELVVYIALFALLSIVITNSLITMMRTYVASANYRALQNNGELIMERIVREVRNGSTVSVSTCNSNPGTLTVGSTDSGGTAHTNIFSLSNGVAYLTTDGGAATALSTNEVTVPLLSFCSFATANGVGVKAQLQLTSTREVIVNANFYTTVILRQ